MVDHAAAKPAEKLTKKQLKTLKFKEAKKNKGEPKASAETPVFTADYEGAAPPNKRKNEEALAPAKKAKQETEVQTPKVTEEKSKKNPTKKVANKKGAKGKEQPESGPANKTPAAKNAKYIVFVGNLPFNCTVEDLKHHLSSCGGDFSVRLLTDKVTKKPKGFAFVEFESSISLSKALHLHHSMLKGRRINVEVTAGGGGSSVNRKQKLTERNEKLTKERALFAEKKKDPKNKVTPTSGDSAGALDPSMNPERAKMLSNKSKARA